MKNFLSDLWHDLRDRRLWPVAVILLAALVAVPVVLLKSPEEPPAAKPAATEARTAPDPEDLKGLATVKLESSDAASGSSLDTFDPSNPFRPPRKVVQGSKEADSAAGSQAGPGSGTDTGTGSSSGSESGGGSVSAGGGPDSGPVDTGSGDTGGGGDPGADRGDGDAGGDETTTQYAYVIDVTFRANGNTRKIKGMERLAMLPNAESPLLLFLGVSPKGGSAVFLVDSTLEAAGEGKCRPSGDECAFLHIGPGSEHEFTNDEGDSYTLRVDEIRRMKVGAKSNAARKDSKTASAAVGKPAPARRFALPLLADLVSVSRGGGNHSNSDSDRR